MNNLKPVAFIAGGGSHLGQALTEELITKGYFVISAARSQHLTDHKDFQWTQLDITDLCRCKTIIDELTDHFDGIDVLINCHGYYPKASSILDLDIQELTTDIDITYKGPAALSKFYVEANKKYSQGKIVFVSSIAALPKTPSYKIIYSANKAAINRFSELLHEEIKGFGMSSQVIMPGQLSVETNEEILKEQKAISYSRLAKIIVDSVDDKGNAFVQSLEIRPC